MSTVNSSKYVGVHWDLFHNKWRAKCANIHQGYFDDEEDAARAYDRAARKHWSSKAKLNFPTDKELQAVKGIHTNKTHGFVGGGKGRPNRHPLYVLWCNIRRRCLSPESPDYKYYGGRGVTVHRDWQDEPLAFFTYVENKLGPRPSHYHSLDRIDVDGNYEPGNLRWSTKNEQMNNMRGHKHQRITNWIQQHYPEIYDEALQAISANDSEKLV